MENDDVKVSAILPVYNVADYLEKAVDSLMNQTWRNIEVIIVNDGSKDDSLEVSRKLEKKYANVIVIDQENSGAAVARNTGMKYATGKYLYFMDPDDWMKPTYIESMVLIAENSDSELVISGFTNVYDDGEHKNETIVSTSEEVFGQTEWRLNAGKYLNNTQLAVPWNKLYLKEFIVQHNLQFPNIKWDDLYFNLEVIRNINQVAINPNYDYQFLRTRPGSETTTVFSGKLFENRKFQFEYVLEVFREWDAQLTDSGNELAYYFSSRVLQVVQEIADAGNLTKTQKKQKIGTILNDSLVRWAFQNTGNGHGLVNIAGFPIRHRMIRTTILMGALIGFVKTHASNQFNSLKVAIMKVK